MTDISKIPLVELSRRSTLRKFALTAGSAALLVATMREREAQAQSKMTQKAVAYQDSPQGSESCGNCIQFTVPASCKIVEGNISPGAWCKVYAKKPA